MKKICLIIAFFWAMHLTILGNSGHIEVAHRKIIIVDDSCTIETSIALNVKSLKIENELLYYSYHQQSMRSVQGELMGYPLHGKYLKYDLSHQPTEAGYFDYGVKDGIWKLFDSSGKLAVINHFRKGVLSGKQIYYKNGKPVSQDFYRKGKLKRYGKQLDKPVSKEMSIELNESKWYKRCLKLFRKDKTALKLPDNTEINKE